MLARVWPNRESPWYFPPLFTNTPQCFHGYNMEFHLVGFMQKLLQYVLGDHTTALHYYSCESGGKHIKLTLS